MQLATLTLEKINEYLICDQGNAFRSALRHTMKDVEDAYREKDSQFRSHLGASLIGRECARELWLSFRWCSSTDFDGRMIRLFNRGHLEEARFTAILKMIGCEVWTHNEDGSQFRITGHKRHFGGSLDGVVIGIPDMPDVPVLTEFKTHGDKSFQTLKSDGVQKAKFEHYVQMQIYMGEMGLTAALYLAVNKNDDELHAEIVHFDEDTYQRYMERAAMIIDAVSPPLRINESPGWYKCRFCSQANVCQKNVPPERNCRSCRWSTPVEDGRWICENQKLLERYSTDVRQLDEDMQYAGCDLYEEHPDIRARS